MTGGDINDWRWHSGLRAGWQGGDSPSLDSILDLFPYPNVWILRDLTPFAPGHEFWGQKSRKYFIILQFQQFLLWHLIHILIPQNILGENSMKN